MIRKDKKYKDDNEFVSLTESRNEVGEICGKAAADQMAECCFYGNFVEGLRQRIEDQFFEVSEGKGW
jgi:hypothetical protein